MKKLLLLLPLLACTMFVLAQTAEQRSPNIQVKNLDRGESPVRISDVKIDVKVIGSLAVTTVDLTFYNPNNRILEGELQFPLADGQSVSRFALDIDGKLREGVVIEKAKGQAVFESTIRRKVDPGLLEKTAGNNFRTRVYPLPSKGTRRVVIAYEQELPSKEGQYQFFLPIAYGDKLDNFALNLTAFANEQAPHVDTTPWGEFAFKQAGNAYVASYAAKQYAAKGQLVFSIPTQKQTQTYVEDGQLGHETVFYSRILATGNTNAKVQPKRIALFWDASASMSKRNFGLESELLNSYFDQLGNVTVDLHTFNCIVGKPQTFNIVNGDWSALEKALINTPYDGATQFGILNFKKLKVDEILLFSDALSNFGKHTPMVSKTRVSVVNSSLIADHSMAKYIASVSGGTYINLMQQVPSEGLKELLNEKFRLISATYNSNEIKDFTSSDAGSSTSGFSISGKLLSAKATIVLNFGIGSQISHTETVDLRSKDAKDYGNIIERIWAARKIADLDMLYTLNENEISTLAKRYGIVTRNTSLIVLDDVHDYVQHRITPPADLLNAYNAIVRTQAKEKEVNIGMRIDDISDLLTDRIDWWKQDFPKKEPKPKKQKLVSTRSPSSNSPSRVLDQTNTYNGTSVSGIVRDDTNEPLIGVAVIVKGTSRGIVTNMEGSYTLNVSRGETLVFQYIGMNSLEVPVTGSTLNVVLSDNEAQLDEVVVVGYGTQRRRDMTSSVQTIYADEMVEESSDNLDSNVIGSLQGKMAGVQVQQESSKPENITIRGTGSIASATPLYVLDGEVVSDIGSISTDDIESMEVLKDAAATGVYGSRGANGVIIITTKNAPNNNNATSKLASSASKGIHMKEWEPNMPYLKEFTSQANNNMYATYLAIRKDYEDTPSFFLDVADLFEKRGLKEEAFIILSNLAELKLEDYKLFRVLAHRMKQLGYNEYAIDLFKTVLRLRPEEPQSYRDLGLAYIDNGSYQKGIDMLHRIFEQEWDDRFEDIELFAVEEINNGIAKAKHAGIKLDLKNIDKRLLYSMPVDIRIVMSWDTDNSDMDLHVIDPDGEECYYSHQRTRIGGLISDDCTDGYGPEVFLLKKAIKGTYKIKVNYYGTREQTLIGPTTIYLDIFTHYSGRKEKKETITLRLDENEGKIDIGEITF